MSAIASAISLNARASAEFDAKLAETKALLPRFGGMMIWAPDHDGRERRWISPPVA